MGEAEYEDFWLPEDEFSATMNEILARNKYSNISKIDLLLNMNRNYVVATTSRKSHHKTLFAVNPSLKHKVQSKNWTTVLAFAKGYKTTEEAFRYMEKLKYNNPRIYQVRTSGQNNYSIDEIELKPVVWNRNANVIS